ncbi:hypothetical protein D3C75_942020 [compost metagenome]
MHDDGVRLGQLQALFGEAVELEELAFAGQQATLHALALQAQHDHHVDILEAFGQVGVGAHAILLDADRQQRLRRDDADVRAA